MDICGFFCFFLFLWLKTFFFFIFFIFKLYNIVLVLPYINMNPPQVYTCSPSWTFLPPCTIPLSHPSAPAPSIQYRASNLDWQLVSYMILYMFQCHSPKSSHPLPLPQSPIFNHFTFFFRERQCRQDRKKKKSFEIAL